MELVVGLFTALAPEAGAVAAGAAAGAGGLAAGATVAGASSALSILSGVATAGSAIFSLASGLSQSAQEDLAAKAEANRIRREALLKIDALRVAFAGSGVDIAAADPLEQDIRSQQRYETNVALGTGQIRSTNALFKGAGQALTTATGGVIDIARRG